jgi:hypothetical protein
MVSEMGLDFLELSMEGKKVIVLVTTDYYSDFIEVDFLKSTTADISKVAVTDNGPQFISAVWKF